jgi:hypothetical protein
MDDRRKLEIRKEFTARFWRLMIIVPVMVGLLVWWWLAEDKHGGFLFLTLLPLVFLIPLARYYYAVRALTEPTAENIAAAAAADSVIDPETRSRVRRNAMRLHWIAQAFLLALILLGVLARWGSGKIAEARSKYEISHASSIVMSEFGRFFFGRGRELIAYAPPTSPDERLAWAKAIEERLGQPVAVFIKESASITWVTRRDSLEAGMAQVPHLFDTHLSRTERGTIDTIGSYEVRRISEIEPKGSGFRTWIVGPLDCDLRWGVVLNFRDIWPAFFRSLKDAEKSSPPMDLPAYPIKDYISLGRTLSRNNPGMRVFMNGNVLYASPGLDTTCYRYSVDSPPLLWEYYQPEMDKNYATLLAKGPVTWRNFIGWAVLMGALFQLYWWIRKLTAPGD